MSARGFVAITFGFKISIDDGKTWQDFACDVNSVTDTPSTNQVTWRVACPGGSGSASSAPTYALQVTSMVDLGTDSLWTFLDETPAGKRALVAWQPDPVNYPAVVKYYAVTLMPPGLTENLDAANTFQTTFGVTGAPSRIKPSGAADPFPTTITAVTAGSPGTFTPAGVTAPGDLADLKADTHIGDAGSAKPTTAWTAGQYVDLGDGSTAHWSGTAWVAGKAS